MTEWTGLAEPTPEQLEAQVANTRASLDSKLHELERRLSPRGQMERVRAHVEPERYLGAAAAAAVAVGASLAYRGLRHSMKGRTLTSDTSCTSAAEWWET